MKRLIALLVVFLFSLEFGFAGGGEKHATLNIKGMTCGGCVSVVKKAIKSLDGVQSVDVNLEKGVAEVSYLPDEISPNDLLASVNKTRFTATLSELHQQQGGKMGMKGRMKMVVSPELDQVRSELHLAKEKLAKDGLYSCCISPSCNFCAIAMNQCPCGVNLQKGMPVCGECKGGWMAGYGALPDIKSEEVKTMPMEKNKMAYEMRAKMAKMSQKMSDRKGKK